MLTNIRKLTNAGCLTAALLITTPAYSQTGGTGTFSGGGGGTGGGGGGGTGGGGGGGGNSGGAQNVGQGGIQGQQLGQGIEGNSLLGSFATTGSGRTGGGSSIISPTNILAGTYYNPQAQGLMSATGATGGSTSTAGFGNPLYGNMTSGSYGSLGGRSSGSAFGGSSATGRGSFGGTSSYNTGLSGTATSRGGTSGTIAPSFTGGAWGPAIGRRGPIVAATLRNPARAIAIHERRPDLQDIIARSTWITTPGGIVVNSEGNGIVLNGTVANEDERRIAENMLRLHPGVSRVQNNLVVAPPPGPLNAGPGPMAPGGTPGPSAPSQPAGTIRLP